MEVFPKQGAHQSYVDEFIIEVIDGKEVAGIREVQLFNPLLTIDWLYPANPETSSGWVCHHGTHLNPSRAASVTLAIGQAEQFLWWSLLQAIACGIFHYLIHASLQVQDELARQSMLITIKFIYLLMLIFHPLIDILITMTFCSISLMSMLSVSYLRVIYNMYVCLFVCFNSIFTGPLHTHPTPGMTWMSCCLEISGVGRYADSTGCCNI